MVEDGTVYAASATDPAFRLLGALEGEDGRQWTPLDQLPGACEDEAAARSVCTSTEVEGETFYRLDDKIANAWLRRKWERVVDALRRQAERAGGSTVDTGGDIDAGFHLPGEEDVPEDRRRGDAAGKRRSEIDAAAVVCSVLSEKRTQLFLKDIGIDFDDLTGKKKRKIDGAAQRVAAVTPETMREYTIGTTTPDRNADGTKKMMSPSARSVGNKSLEKVNRKGMRSMTSFFGKKK